MAPQKNTAKQGQPSKQSSGVERALLHPRCVTLGELLYLFALQQFVCEMGAKLLDISAPHACCEEQIMRGFGDVSAVYKDSGGTSWGPGTELRAGVSAH